MTTFDIYVAYVSWNIGGKRRPVLILEEAVDNVTTFSITTKYEAKNEAIRARYFTINGWKQAGLVKPSYVDTNKTITVPITAVDKNPIGKLSVADEIRLIEFIFHMGPPRLGSQ